MPDLAGLLLDPRDPMDLETITGLQLRLAGLAERLGRFIVLLDVPPGLSQRQILRWRSRFATSWAAAYHPWLRVSRADDRRDALIRVNPSAVAAGLIARQELLFGVPHGPANALAAGVVDVDERVSPARHDELHPAGVNVWLRERDGVRLTAARTLARDARYRQLSVRRLMLMLRRALEQQTQWMVFEPNGPALRGEVRNLLRLFLRQLFRAGAFRGATEAEAFFVRCDEELNPPRVVDRGELIAEVGVAPAEPMEFLVVRLARGADWTVTVEV
jgi:phage tail sheath protein FI